MTEVLTAALAWHDAAYCVLPARADGTKAPDAVWKAYQYEQPSRDAVEAWFAGGRPGLGLLCGAISGNLEMLELEGRAVAEGAIPVLQDLVVRAGLTELWERVTHGYSEQTPSGGVHLLYRVADAAVPGNTKLANRPARDDELTDDERAIKERAPHRVISRGLAETRGEGGFVVIAPSHGPTHPTGRPWVTWYGGPGTVPTITTDEREQLHRLVRCLDAMPVPEAPARALQVVRDSHGGTSPGDDFETKVAWDDELLLGGAGWTPLFAQGSTTYWRRPGKDTPGISATTGRDPARDRLYVFSSSTEFDTETPITKFGAYCLLHHGGDFKAAAKELRRQGFGTPPPAPPAAPQPTAGSDALPAVDGNTVRKLDVAAEEQTGGGLASPSQPLAVARQLAARMTTPRVWWRGDFYQWSGAHYDAVETSVIEHWIYGQTEHASYYAGENKDGGPVFKDWAPSKRKVADVAHALGVGALQRFGEAEHVTAVTNGVLKVTTVGRTLLPHSPTRFNLFSLPFAYEPDADCPAWLAFLDSVLPGDQQAHEFLAEWFGYVMSGRTDQQKMAALIGPRRSGKGTIARVLTAMLGQPNVAGLDLNHLPGTFGLENLIGRALAIAGDVRWHSRNIGDAVPLLLRIIGEDVMDVARKNRTTWNGLLPVRIMMMSNDTPTFTDRSGALGGRMIYVKFEQSFYGREDSELTGKLLDELPGILNWALDGLARLAGRGRFTEPESGLAEAEAVRRLSDPIGAFIEDWCQIGAEHKVDLDVLFMRYRAWCESEGRTKDTTTKEIFSRDLRTKVDGLVVKRERIQGKQVRFLYGIGCLVQSTGAGGGYEF
jgi:putative DNA primase/helicase